MKLRIGTRESPLALKQTNLFIQHLNSIGIHKIDIVPIKTTGDIIRDRPLYDIGGKALFAKEIECALLNKEIDCAVHSLKDLETIMAPGLILASILERADPRDCLISRNNLSLKNLPLGAHVGTCSPRREAQLKIIRPDLKISSIRGNIETRINQVREGHYDATLLAVAGLTRMGLIQNSCELFDPKDILPAAGQGAIAIQIREEAHELLNILTPINHELSARCVLAEREVLRHILGNCRTPIAAYAIPQENGKLFLRAKLWRDDTYRYAEEVGENPSQLALQIALTLMESDK